ncbi:hypothetical protein P9112_005693 [Eukaryota sp. TZLM1-RC]
MTSLPCEAWTNVCQVNEVVSKTCARFQCLLCDEVYSVNRWAMEGHYVPDLLPKRQVPLCNQIGCPESNNGKKVADLRVYLATHSRQRKRRASSINSPAPRQALPSFSSPSPLTPFRGGRSSSKKYWDWLNGADVPNEPDELEVSSGVSSDEDVIEIHE